MFFRTRNIFQVEFAVVASDIETTITGRIKDFKDFVKKESAIKNKAETVVTIIGGCHGNSKGNSGFTDPKLLDSKQAKKYKRSIKEGDWKTKETNKMTFTFIDIKDYHFSFSANPSKCPSVNACNYKSYDEQSRKLVEELEALKTTILLISWCYANNGDVMLALRRNAHLSRIILEQEMRYLGLTNAKLSDEQAEVLEAAMHKKDIILVGSAGAGKTVIAVESVKIKLADSITKKMPTKVIVMTCNRSAYQLKSAKLLEDEEGYTDFDEYMTNKSLLHDIKKWFKNMEKYGIEFSTVQTVLQLDIINSSFEEAISRFESKIEKDTNYIFLIDELDYNITLSYHDQVPRGMSNENLMGNKDPGVPIAHNSVLQRSPHELVIADYSYLQRFRNISFVIAINPVIWDYDPFAPNYNPFAPNFTMQFPSDSNEQFYRRLKCTYRNTYGIQIFLKHMSTSKYVTYEPNKDPDDYNYGLDCMVLNPNEDVKMNPNELPPPYKNYPIPVIWIKFCKNTIKEAAQKLIDIVKTLDLSNQIVPVLTNFEANFEIENCLVNDLVTIEGGVLFKEYKGYSFVGSESDIAIVLIEKYHDTNSTGVFSQREQIIHQVSRARKLLIICSYTNELDDFMEKSFKFGLATKVDLRKYSPTDGEKKDEQSSQELDEVIWAVKRIKLA